MQKCKACKKEIIFLSTKKGKLIPVNYDSLSEDDKKKINEGTIIMFNYKKHISHFADCPFAKSFRLNPKFIIIKGIK